MFRNLDRSGPHPSSGRSNENPIFRNEPGHLHEAHPGSHVIHSKGRILFRSVMAHRGEGLVLGNDDLFRIGAMLCTHNDLLSDFTMPYLFPNRINFAKSLHARDIRETRRPAIEALAGEHFCIIDADGLDLYPDLVATWIRHGDVRDLQDRWFPMFFQKIGFHEA